MTASEKEEWHQSVKYELFGSEEFKELEERFSGNGLQRLDLGELRRRNFAAVEQLNLLRASESYLRLRDFLKGGKHTIVDLYNELAQNPLHQEEILVVTWSVENPDIAMEGRFSLRGRPAWERPTWRRCLQSRLTFPTADLICPSMRQSTVWRRSSVSPRSIGMRSPAC